MAGICKEAVPQTVEEKKCFLLRNGIAVWDVIAECDITGSSDSSIRNVKPADIRRILDAAKIERICCNGATAYRLYEKYLFPLCKREAVKLPSSSPANAAWSAERLMEEWGKYFC